MDRLSYSSEASMPERAARCLSARARIFSLVMLLPFGLLLGCNKKQNATAPHNGPANAGSTNDTELSQQVADRILQDPTLKNSGIQVESKNGVVTLTGEVDEETEKTAAASIAGQVAGVRQVVLSLTVSDFAALARETRASQPKPVERSISTPHAAVPQPAVRSAPSYRPPSAAIASAPPRPARPPIAESTPRPAMTPAASIAKVWNNPIDRYLSRKPNPRIPSPLAGSGTSFESDGKQYTIDPRLIVGISGAETSFATGRCHSTPVSTTRNAWNWFYCYGSNSCGKDVCSNSPFNSWERGIHTVSKYVQRNYIMKGLTDVRKIQTKYCISGCENWVPNVEAFMKEMGGDPEHLTLGNPTR